MLFIVRIRSVIAGSVKDSSQTEIVYKYFFLFLYVDHVIMFCIVVRRLVAQFFSIKQFNFLHVNYIYENYYF